MLTLGNCCNCFPKWLYQFTFSLAMYEGFTFLPVLANTYHLFCLAALGLPCCVFLAGSSLQLWCVGFSLRWLLLLWDMGSVLWRTASYSEACGVFGDRTHAPCIGRQIPSHQGGPSPAFLIIAILVGVKQYLVWF